jgi:hypothetical protein
MILYCVTVVGADILVNVNSSATYGELFVNNSIKEVIIIPACRLVDT